MNLLLGFIFFLCLLLLVMIFGDQLSVFGALKGSWVRSLLESVGNSWKFVCEEVDRCWCFIVEHFWWVLVVGSGGSGLMLVAWMVIGGVADRAATELAGRSGRMHAGGILDRVPDIASARQLLKTALPMAGDSVTAHVDQSPAVFSQTLNHDQQAEHIAGGEDRPRDNFLTLPDFTGPGTRNYGESQPANRRTSDGNHGSLPILKPEQRYQAGRDTKVFSRWDEAHTPDDDSIRQISGTTVTSHALKEEIDAALAHLKIARRQVAITK